VLRLRGLGQSARALPGSGTPSEPYRPSEFHNMLVWTHTSAVMPVRTTDACRYRGTVMSDYQFYDPESGVASWWYWASAAKTRWGKYLTGGGKGRYPQSAAIVWRTDRRP
jgi:hypothetical protein